MPPELTIPAPTAAPRRPVRWPLVYYLLAAFDLLAITGSLYLGHQVMGIFRNSVEINQQWAARLSDLSEIARAAGAAFSTFDVDATMLASEKPVIAVCAVRTGCGKSQTARRVARILRGLGKRVAVVRHPMPYGDLTKQVCQRFATLADMDMHHCTIEEREEYEPHIAAGNVVYAGVDYARIVAAAQQEADVIVWDGGNNDFPFLRPGLHVVLVDPLRAGDETLHHPGEAVLRMARGLRDSAPEGTPLAIIGAKIGRAHV